MLPFHPLRESQPYCCPPNSDKAIGALQACAELGKRVPQDIAITGFDDISLAALVTPGLTTCRVPSYEMGAQAMHALIDRMNGCAGGCSNVNFQPELVIRQSAP